MFILDLFSRFRLENSYYIDSIASADLSELLNAYLTHFADIKSNTYPLFFLVVDLRLIDSDFACVWERLLLVQDETGQELVNLSSLTSAEPTLTRIGVAYFLYIAGYVWNSETAAAAFVCLPLMLRLAVIESVRELKYDVVPYCLSDYDLSPEKRRRDTSGNAA